LQNFVMICDEFC